MQSTLKSVEGTSYVFDQRMQERLVTLKNEVEDFRSLGALSSGTLKKLRQFFRIKNIHHSNAIEGNVLTLGETQIVVEEGLTITGKPLKDSLEAKNLSHALDLFEKLADGERRPIFPVDVRNIHAAILKGIEDENAGKYRTTPVQISGSKYKPPGPEKVNTEMDDFTRWLSHITDPSVKIDEDPVVLACAAHAWFVTIHPFTDGNGRTARLIMNLVLMRYSYPIAIVTTDDRERYYDALEESQSTDLTLFLDLITECIEESLEQYQDAAAEQRQHIEWAKSLAQKLDEKPLQKIRLEYEKWKPAMELIRSTFRETAFIINENLTDSSITMKDFSMLEFEKYQETRNQQSPKRSWFFRLDFRSGDKVARYLFFFGYASHRLAHHLGGKGVTLHISQEMPQIERFFFERLDTTKDKNAPDICEIAFDLDKMEFVSRFRNDSIDTNNSMEKVVQHFIEQVVARRMR